RGAFAQQGQPARNAPAAARRHDHRIGPLVAGGPGQRHGEPQEAERPADGQQRGDPPDHSIRLSAPSTVNRAVSIASATPATGIAASSAQPIGPNAPPTTMPEPSRAN